MPTHLFKLLCGRDVIEMKTRRGPSPAKGNGLEKEIEEIWVAVEGIQTYVSEFLYQGIVRGLLKETLQCALPVASVARI